MMKWSNSNMENGTEKIIYQTTEVAVLLFWLLLFKFKFSQASRAVSINVLQF